MNLFVFGTLMDPEVRELVCGKPLERVEPAVVQGFRRVFVAGRHYPMLLPRASGWVDGTLLWGVDPESLHRLQVYEGWEYTLRPVQVRTASGSAALAHVFICPPEISADKRDWRFDLWILRHKRRFLPKTQWLMQVALRIGRLPGTHSGQRPRPGLAPRHWRVRVGLPPFP